MHLYSALDEYLLEACSRLLTEVSVKMNSTQNGHSVGLLRGMVPLVLLVHGNIEGREFSKKDNPLALFLDCWVKCKDVIGDESFGGKDSLFSPWRGKDELNVSKKCNAIIEFFMS